MEYHHTHPGAAAYFPGAQPYQFIGMPPLTPSHSNSGPSEEFNSTPPIPTQELYTDYNPHEQQFQTFESYTPAPFPQVPNPDPQQQPPQRHPQQTFPAPLTPPNAAAIHGHAHAAQILNGSPGGLVVSPPLQGPKEELTEQQRAPQLAPKTSSNTAGAGSNSAEEEESGLGTNKRKAQNRAAQRAFRERKERHVKDLEAKLADLEAAQQQAATENEKLKRDLQKISTENEILRATSHSGGAGGSPSHSHGSPPLETGPMRYNPTDFYSDVLDGHDNKTFSHRISLSSDGERLYDAGATWDLIVNHDLYKQGLVDVAEISNSLKGLAKCDGQGPVFKESDIVTAIERSVANGSDTLI
ncbi:hypothetical protein MCOR02_000790 [Pyricularia oryzae]|uniref:BZIP domain-containing protein n=2 Tax=Pyricularia TaxID=48558 RepID=A0ABQ8N5Q9_PYRGI|nr:uncharacterized protein MGG_02632 [Pyricularia oryzae 70-15]KAH9437135.1 hypothetical protein MCOR02_000790 [Pyricularia oryzae]KAI6291785.1 hypothetical protein MCOR33_010352 [Pyricularia grisea]EHA46414.1 hypothetical protein MGG_02632 [Pyricularia oryzae 70-15]KAI6260534.1 hypothetical protein MCOR19_003218 [Pyricularia oryzae]KAI6274655.1 hypothetical protein MCOR26_006407 [Pyricularia oryzae]